MKYHKFSMISWGPEHSLDERVPIWIRKKNTNYEITILKKKKKRSRMENKNDENQKNFAKNRSSNKRNWGGRPKKYTNNNKYNDIKNKETVNIYVSTRCDQKVSR